ncbi:hypothetical protein FZEAL_8143 [Fusarium zealandicum]|uniref:Uncharacterized protein n=1 Tax=Fusarium zealandicum TaxID=1053134 RepID=A0A8H4XH64_9HYPO|nr:hypothetical protein FZEAL_8143 [Fusarium zealandicum]
MQLTYTAVVLGSLAAVASASVKREFQFPDTVPLSRRQTSGPEYECHANCGYTIMNAEDEGYCDSDEWNELLDGCLKCANEYDMWADYGRGVQAAAEACGLEAEPVGASGSSASGTAVATTTVTASTTTVADSTTTVAATTMTSEVPETTVMKPIIPVTTASETVVESTPGANTTPGAEPTNVESDNAASNYAFSGVLAVGAALAAVAGLI